jgi:hypothetical protein
MSWAFQCYYARVSASFDYRTAIDIPSDVKELGVKRSGVQHINSEVCSLVWVFKSTSVLFNRYVSAQS